MMQQALQYLSISRRAGRIDYRISSDAMRMLLNAI